VGDAAGREEVAGGGGVGEVHAVVVVADAEVSGGTAAVFPVGPPVRLIVLRDQPACFAPLPQSISVLVAEFRCVVRGNFRIVNCMSSTCEKQCSKHSQSR
jgi:hypothetical protein